MSKFTDVYINKQIQNFPGTHKGELSLLYIIGTSIVHTTTSTA